MPRYDVRCSTCHREWETWARVSEVIRCACGGAAERLISAPTIVPDSLDARSYDDDGLGVRITSRSQRRRLMKANSLEEVGPSKHAPHGARGTVFSFPGQATTSVPPSGAYVDKRR